MQIILRQNNKNTKSKAIIISQIKDNKMICKAYHELNKTVYLSDNIPENQEIDGHSINVI